MVRAPLCHSGLRGETGGGGKERERERKEGSRLPFCSGWIQGRPASSPSRREGSGRNGPTCTTQGGEALDRTSQRGEALSRRERRASRIVNQGRELRIEA